MSPGPLLLQQTVWIAAEINARSSFCDPDGVPGPSSQFQPWLIREQVMQSDHKWEVERVVYDVVDVKHGIVINQTVKISLEPLGQLDGRFKRSSS